MWLASKRVTAATVVAAILVVGTLRGVLAHGHDEDENIKGVGGEDNVPGNMGAMDMGVDMGASTKPEPDATSYPPTYFAHPEYHGTIYAHVAMMTMGWAVVLPLGVMFSIARSRYTLVTQIAFLAMNAVGLVLGISYNAHTPDLYPNNAHHKIGWVATWFVCAQVVISFAGRIAGILHCSNHQKAFRALSDHRDEEKSEACIPLSSAHMSEHQQMQDDTYFKPYRHSSDSGQGTEPNTASLVRASSSTLDRASPIESRHLHYEDDDLDDITLNINELRPASRLHTTVARIVAKIPARIWKFLLFGYNFMDRTVLILGFITLSTGVATWGRFFEGHGIFSGLAHWIKGGIFIWLGLLNLGRWSGSFGELGWAWNVRPKQSTRKWRPTAEFAEGALIFTYGSTNIFLEHLGNWGKEWSPTDLEHLAITVLFIGGGLLAMMIESMRVRELLNTTVEDAAYSHPIHVLSDEEHGALQPPTQYEFSINPIPALVILLLGIMMSSHKQDTMISSMVHKQWGNMLTGASFARGLTYVLLYLKPPRSVLPSRPPTELLAAFGMISGGMLFMASAHDTVNAMIRYHLDAMFMYTITMGLVGMLMAWVVLLLALKGWAVRREARKS